MGIFRILLCATLENITDVGLKPDDEWFFVIKCMSCGEINENEIYFNLIETHDMPGSRGTANFIAKCKYCDKSNSILYMKNTLVPYIIEYSESPKLVCKFECRGWEIISWSLKGFFKAKSSKSDLMLEDIDLSEGDWVGYDNEADCVLGIYDAKTTIEMDQHQSMTLHTMLRHKLDYQEKSTNYLVFEI